MHFCTVEKRRNSFDIGAKKLASFEGCKRQKIGILKVDASNVNFVEKDLKVLV